MRGVKTDGPKIRQLRRDSGSTQKQIAALADCDVKTMRKAENGSERIDFRTAVLIAEALDIEYQSIIRSEDVEENGTVATPERLIELTIKWNQAWLSQEYDSLVAMHTNDTVFELPGVESLPSVELIYHGIDRLREFFNFFSKEMQLVSNDPGTLQINVFGNIVFMRVRATIKHLPSGRSYTTIHVNELEFRGEKVSRRLTVADYDLLRKIYSDQAP